MQRVARCLSVVVLGLLPGCGTPDQPARLASGLLSPEPAVWGNWRVERGAHGTHDAGNVPVVYVLRHGPREVLRLELDVVGGDGLADPALAGWVALRRGAPPDLVILSDSGGQHCCQRGWIYEAADPPRLIFDSAWYGPDGRIGFNDLDHDGSLEIVQDLTTFHYYDGMCYAISPRASAIFAWDARTHRFVPGNSRFPDLWNKTLHEALVGSAPARRIPARAAAKNWDDSEAIKYAESAAITRAAHLAFAGYQSEAFAWLKRQFDSENGERVCATLWRHLESDNYYRCIAGLPMRDREEAMIEHAAGYAGEILKLIGSTRETPAPPAGRNPPTESTPE